MKTAPLFTVATITYNSSKWVREAVESILSSTFTDFELIISDDCSTDNTWKIIQEYKDERIVAVRNKQNLGEYANRNQALQLSKGKYILYIDGDDILYKDSLAKYANYIQYFPDAKAVWGVYPVFFDFVVLPYQFTPIELTALNYLSTYPISLVGFAESVFEVEALKKLGGFDNRFAIGDTYIKRKFSCFYNVVLIPAGQAFWRQTPHQASNRVRQNYRQLKEMVWIDNEILQADYFPLTGSEKGIAFQNFKNRSIKSVVRNTLQKKRVFDFFRLMRSLPVSFFGLKYLFKKGDYSYKAGGTPETPLCNSYHFSK